MMMMIPCSLHPTCETLCDTWRSWTLQRFTTKNRMFCHAQAPWAIAQCSWHGVVVVSLCSFIICCMIIATVWFCLCTPAHEACLMKICKRLAWHQMIWVLSICSSSSLLQLALMRSKAVCRLLLHDDVDHILVPRGDGVLNQLIIVVGMTKLLAGHACAEIKSGRVMICSLMQNHGVHCGFAFLLLVIVIISWDDITMAASCCVFIIRYSCCCAAATRRFTICKVSVVGPSVDSSSGRLLVVIKVIWGAMTMTTTMMMIQAAAEGCTRKWAGSCCSIIKTLVAKCCFLQKSWIWVEKAGLLPPQANGPCACIMFLENPANNPLILQLYHQQTRTNTHTHTHPQQSRPRRTRTSGRKKSTRDQQAAGNIWNFVVVVVPGWCELVGDGDHECWNRQRHQQQLRRRRPVDTHAWSSWSSRLWERGLCKTPESSSCPPAADHVRQAACSRCCCCCCCDVLLSRPCPSL